MFIWDAGAVASDAVRAPLRREAIVDEARALIRAEGVDVLSLRKLAGRLDVTAPALYAHITSKRDLLAAIAERGFEDLIEAMEAVTDDDPVARLKGYADAYLDAARADPELFRVLFLFAPAFDGGEDGQLDAATRAFALPLATVEEAIATGAIASDDPLLVALTLWSTAHGVAATLQLDLPLDEEHQQALATAAIDRLLAGWRT